MSNRRVVLIQRPVGVPRVDDFAFDMTTIPRLGDGQILVCNQYLSVDPAQRGWASAGDNYVGAATLGEVMPALAVGQILESRTDRFAIGDHVYGFFGWQEFCVATAADVLRRIDLRDAPASAFLGVLGISGLTARLALDRIGVSREETVLVSTAAGAVGSLVGALARDAGARPVGLTGSDEKVHRCTDTFGYEIAVNYKAADLSEALDAACPDGVDLYFDNAGGWVLDAVLPRMAIGGRILQCGTAAVQSWDPPPFGPRVERRMLVRRLQWRGFLVFDHRRDFEDAYARLLPAYRAGKLPCDQDISDGLQTAPQALAELFAGRNTGKRIVRLDAA